jgi:hypothetical protein
MMAERRNGESGIQYPKPPKVPLSVDEREALAHYATMAHHFNHLFEHDLPTIKDNLDQAMSSAMAACGMAKQTRDLLVAYLESQRADALVKRVLAVPPMRPSQPSSFDLLEHASAAFKTELEHRASETPGPSLEATPEELSKLAEDVFAREFAKREQAKEFERLTKIEQGDLQRERERADFRKQVRVGVAVGVLVTLTVAAVTYMTGRVTGQTAGHDQGFAEGIQHAPHHEEPAAPTAAATQPAAPNSGRAP